MPIKPEEFTRGFMEAVRVLGEYIAGRRPWGWGVFAATELLRHDVGIGVPSRAPTGAEAGALAYFGILAQRLRAGEELSDENQALMGTKTTLANHYLQGAFHGLTLDLDTFAPNRIEDVETVNLNRKVQQLSATTVEGPDPLDDFQLPRLPDLHYWDHPLNMVDSVADLDLGTNEHFLVMAPDGEPHYLNQAGRRDLPFPDPNGEAV